jgi:hypothetical protein
MRFILALLLLSSCSWAADPIKTLRSHTVRLSNGSGSLVQGASGKTYLITNFHVAIAAKTFGKLHASFPDGRSVMGQIVAEDREADISAALITNPPIKGLVYAKQWTRGQIYTRGWPQGVLSESTGVYKDETSYKYTFPIDVIGDCAEGTPAIDIRGVLAGCTYTFDNQLATVYVAPGSSGSPVVNSDGELVNLVESWHPQGYAGLVPYAKLKAFLEKL